MEISNQLKIEEELFYAIMDLEGITWDVAAIDKPWDTEHLIMQIKKIQDKLDIIKDQMNLINIAI